MSSIYATEPQTSGRVIVETTHGPLELRLWCRECPSTTKLFLQLCMDGFFNHAVFHRIVPNFLIQTGALRLDRRSGTAKPARSNTGASQAYMQKHQAGSALTRRRFELNSRIRFNHRGQVAMALRALQDEDEEIMATMQPQFFITLDEASNLDGEHVVFGTVTGPTIFNAIRIGQTEVDEAQFSPTDLTEAPRIERIKIVENPIHKALVPTPDKEVPWQPKEGNTGTRPNKRKGKRRGVKNVNILSFGDELEDKSNRAAGINSSHDVLSGNRVTKTCEGTLKSKRLLDDDQKAPPLRPGEDRFWDLTDDKNSTMHTEDVREHSKMSISNANTQMLGLPHPGKSTAKQKVNKAKVSLVDARRARYAQKRQTSKRERERNTMAKLRNFQVKTAVVGSGNKKTNELSPRFPM